MTMKTMIGGMIAAVALAFTMTVSADVLFWQVDKDSEVVGAGDQSLGSLERFLVNVPWTSADNNPINVDSQGRPIVDEHGDYVRGNGVADALVVARVNVYSKDGTWLRTMENIHGNVIDESWKAPVDIGHPNSPNGVGATAASSDLNSSAIDLDEYYQIMLLKRDETEWNGNPVLQELAWSDWYSGNWLAHNGSYDLYNDGQHSFDYLTAWTPDTFYTYKPVARHDWHGVPEPSAGLLVMLGIALLGLKRKVL